MPKALMALPLFSGGMTSAMVAPPMVPGPDPAMASDQAECKKRAEILRFRAPHQETESDDHANTVDVEASEVLREGRYHQRAEGRSK